MQKLNAREKRRRRCKTIYFMHSLIKILYEYLIWNFLLYFTVGLFKYVVSNFNAFLSVMSLLKLKIS